MKMGAKIILGAGLVAAVSLASFSIATASFKGQPTVPAASAETVSFQDQGQNQFDNNMCQNLKESDPTAYKEMLDLMNSPEVKKVLDSSEIGRKMYQAMQDEDFSYMQQLMKDPKARQEMFKLMEQPAIKEIMQSMHNSESMQRMHNSEGMQNMHENMMKDPQMQKAHEAMHSGGGMSGMMGGSTTTQNTFGQSI